MSFFKVKAELEKTKKLCQELRKDLSSASADLETKLATLTKQEEELQILRSKVKEQAAAADNDTIDGGASSSPPGEGKAVDGEQNGEAVPTVTPAGGGEEGDFHKSQSSNSVLNSSLPALGTPQDKSDNIKKPGPQPKRSYAMVVAGGKPALSQSHNTSQQYPPLPSSSHPAPICRARRHGRRRNLHNPLHHTPSSRASLPIRDTPVKRKVSSTVSAAHLTDNDSCSDNDRSTTRLATAVEENLSITKDSSVGSDSDSGVESAMSSPTNTTKQSPSDSELIIPRERVASDEGAQV